MTEPARFDVAKVDAAHATGLVAFFDRLEIPCYCRYWHFAGTSNAWLDRSRHAPETNRSELVHALDTGSPEAAGVVAFDVSTNDVVGWMKLAPAASVPKLYDQRLYRGLPCFSGDRDGVLAVGCFLVDPAVRRTGLSDALVQGGVRIAKEAGARAIEAFPRRAEGLRDEEKWTGPFSAFQRAGFAVVHDFGPYPVVRLAL
ncbi:MAG TPA: N-acetyltransferase [Polyangiaceae bacterium]|nr:N-acetyltransferase [Polyangiaceae bacterium]